MTLAPLLNAEKDTSLKVKATTAMEGVEATAHLHAGQAALLSAQLFEDLFEVAYHTLEHFSLMVGIYKQLKLSTEQQQRAHELELTIRASLVTLRALDTDQHFINLAKLVVEALQEIPLPPDPELLSAVTTIT